MRGVTPVSDVDLEGMTAALEGARAAGATDEVPIGAVVARNGAIVARAHNETVARGDPTAHAELLAIQQALGALHTDRLEDCTLYVTLEPCAVGSPRSEEHTSELQSRGHLVCRLLLEKKNHHSHTSKP